MFLKFFCSVSFGLLITASMNNGNYVASNTSLSSSATLAAIKGNNVSLFWSYQLNASAQFVDLEYGCKNKATNISMRLATKNGTNSALVVNVSSDVTNELKERLSIDGNKLVISNVQYNDSVMSYHAIIRYSVSQSVFETYLQPVVQLTVRGNAIFLSQKLEKLTVQDNARVEISEIVEGNPWSSLLSQWSHQPWIEFFNGTQLYPFIYQATFLLEHIDRTYCGRTLNLKAANYHGKSAWRSTIVQVLFNPEEPKNVTTTWVDSCLKVNWIKEDTGLCSLNYTVLFKGENAVTLYEKSGVGIAELSQCNIPIHYNVTSVSVTAQTTNGSKTISKMVTSAQLKGDAFTPKYHPVLCICSSLFLIFMAKMF